MGLVTVLLSRVQEKLLPVWLKDSDKVMNMVEKVIIQLQANIHQVDTSTTQLRTAACLNRQVFANVLADNSLYCDNSVVFLQMFIFVQCTNVFFIY